MDFAALIGKVAGLVTQGARGDAALRQKGRGGVPPRPAA
ncbi:MAG: hypothetical protein Q27BPR15_08695 [Rhodobacter sp. CACIA14H1]|nr:MAG: hypothetical protein Q27BPR15_08695 [Rhodobacter sp. CACIA14H1]